MLFVWTAAVLEPEHATIRAAPSPAAPTNARCIYSCWGEKYLPRPLDLSPRRRLRAFPSRRSLPWRPPRHPLPSTPTRADVDNAKRQAQSQLNHFEPFVVHRRCSVDINMYWLSIPTDKQSNLKSILSCSVSFIFRCLLLPSHAS